MVLKKLILQTKDPGHQRLWNAHNILIYLKSVADLEATPTYDSKAHKQQKMCSHYSLFAPLLMNTAASGR